MSFEEIELSILIPCLNEENNVQGALANASAAARAAGRSFEILVIDDGSTDATYQKACEFRDSHPEFAVTVHKNPTNRGLGAGFFDGAAMTRGKYYRLCCGDNVESADALKKIFENIGRADIIAPYHPSDSSRPWARRVLSGSYTQLINWISGHHLRYYNGCPAFLRADVVKLKKHTSGFGFQAQLLTQMLDDGATILEIPVETTDRTTGESKALTTKNLVSTGQVLVEIAAQTAQKNYFLRIG